MILQTDNLHLADLQARVFRLHDPAKVEVWGGMHSFIGPILPETTTELRWSQLERGMLGIHGGKLPLHVINACKSIRFEYYKPLLSLASSSGHG